MTSESAPAEGLRTLGAVFDCVAAPELLRGMLKDALEVQDLDGEMQDGAGWSVEQGWSTVAAEEACHPILSIFWKTSLAAYTVARLDRRYHAWVDFAVAIQWTLAEHHLGNDRASAQFVPVFPLPDPSSTAEYMKGTPAATGAHKKYLDRVRAISADGPSTRCHILVKRRADYTRFVSMVANRPDEAAKRAGANAVSPEPSATQFTEAVLESYAQHVYAGVDDASGATTAFANICEGKPTSLEGDDGVMIRLFGYLGTDLLVGLFVGLLALCLVEQAIPPVRV